MRNIRQLIIHCSDTETGNAASIDRYHRDVKGWQMIGYHYVIDRDGKLELGRPEWMQGAHCFGMNRDSLGICLIGKTEFTKEQFDTLHFVIADLKKKYWTIKEVRGHRDYPSGKAQGKTCPSDAVEAYLHSEGLYE